MNMSLRRTAVGMLAALVFAAPVAARADDDDDHDLARDLHEEGEIRALSEILESARRHVFGDIVAVELVRLEDHWVYRLQVLSADGRRTRVDLDASEHHGENHRE